MRLPLLALPLAALCACPTKVSTGLPDGGPPADAGLGAGVDAGIDAGPAPDAGLDAGPDGGFDTGADGGLDAGPPDAGRGLPILPIGLDAYRRWDLWPRLRLGERAYLRSTYDRAGGNEGADASHFLRGEAVDYLPLDLSGPGVLYFFRANHWHGSPWDFIVDGVDTTVQESSTATPNNPVANSTFLPAAAFPPPLALTWSTTQGADVSWVPMPFTSSLILGYQRTDYGTGYYLYDLFPEQATNLSQPLQSWTPTAPTQDVLDLLNSAGQDIAPDGGGVDTLGGTFDLADGGTTTVASLTGPAVIRVLSFSVPLGEEQAFGAATLQVIWDGRPLPSIDAPVSLFFGAGSLFNRANAEYLVRALPVSIHFGAQTVDFAVYLPMPFSRSAQIGLTSGGRAVPGVSWSLRTVAPTDPPGSWGYLHATFHDQPNPPPVGEDLVLLDTTVDEGGGDWCGSFIGTSFIFSDQAVLTTLEGDPRFFFDDSQTPQAQGTGTEEWGAGGDYWEGGEITTLPLAGHPVGAPSAAAALNAQDEIESAYRFLLADLMPFGRNARIQLEHGGLDDSVEHYQTVAYWYGLPSACLVPTDSLHVSDPQDEAAHDYVSPQASSVDTVTSRYEWGVDAVGSTVIYPATTDTGRHTQGQTTFTLALDPDNWGVLLRRKLDYAYPDQAAQVAIGDVSSDAGFAPAGTWYLAGSNTCVFSDPGGELDPPTPVVETSNRQWRDDEFQIPWQLTRGRSAVRVQLTFAPRDQPLLPDAGLPPQAWSEYRYTAYCWKLPPAP